MLKLYGQGIYKTTIKAKEGADIVLDVTTDGIYNNEFYDFTVDGANVSNIKGIYLDVNYIPVETPKALVVILHGMSEHKERYNYFLQRQVFKIC